MIAHTHAILHDVAESLLSAAFVILDAINDDRRQRHRGWDDYHGGC